MLVSYTMLRIDAPHFCAGAIVENGVITAAAPILKWTVNKKAGHIMSYCSQKNWDCTILRWAIKKDAP